MSNDHEHESEDFVSVADPGESLMLLKHEIPLESGGKFVLREYFRRSTWLAGANRVALFLSGTAVDADFWTIPTPGYNGPEILAEHGILSFTLDYLAVGDNYWEGADGRHDSTFDANQAALQKVVRYIRHSRGVQTVDLIGESWGAMHALRLAEDPEFVRTCIMSAIRYKDPGDPRFLSPEFAEFLKQAPSNYIPIEPDFYRMVTHGAPGEVTDIALREQQPRRHLSDQMWQVIENGLPCFDPSGARVPGLLICGSFSAEDGKALVEDYGSQGAELQVIEGAGHSPRLGAPSHAEEYWRQVLLFMDNH